MLDKSKFIGFAATTRAAKAREFYENILGLSLISEDQFALVYDANGTMLRIQKVENVAPHEYTTLGWQVADIKRIVSGLAEKGVKAQRYAGMEQDENGIWQSPSGAQIAWFLDPDGNILSLTQF